MRRSRVHRAIVISITCLFLSSCSSYIAVPPAEYKSLGYDNYRVNLKSGDFVVASWVRVLDGQVVMDDIKNGQFEGRAVGGDDSTITVSEAEVLSIERIERHDDRAAVAVGGVFVAMIVFLASVLD